MYVYCIPITILDERFYSIPLIKAYLLIVLVVSNMLLFQSISEEKLERIQ